MDPSSLPVRQRIALLVKALDGAEKTNKALATCPDGDSMVDILLGASAKLGLGLTRRDLTETSPIRDWIWFKNNDPLLTVGDAKPRYQRAQSNQTAQSNQPEQPSSEREATDTSNPDQPQRRRFFGLF